MAKRVPGKEEFYEAIRYWENRIKSINDDNEMSEGGNGNGGGNGGGKVHVKLNTDMTVNDMSNHTTEGTIDKWIVSTGVIPRDIQIPGSNQVKFPNRVLSYVDVLRHNKPVGKRVAVIGAGGIGFDVSEFLLYGKQSSDTTDNSDTDTSTCPAAEVSIEDFWKEWGVDPTQEYRGGLAKDGPSLPHGKPDRTIYLMQRKKGKVGGGLGKTTGWIHRASLNNSNQVTNIPGVQSYDKIDENGNLVYTDSNTGTQCILEVDTIVLCAGQLEERTLENGSKSISNLHDKVYPIGGAYKAGELDAKRAIDMGTRLAHKIHLKDVIPGNHVFHSSVGTEEKLFRFLKKWT
jgi:2,4-dienoyl-CoA reductase (NADPH2)